MIEFLSSCSQLEMQNLSIERDCFSHDWVLPRVYNESKRIMKDKD